MLKSVAIYSSIKHLDMYNNRIAVIRSFSALFSIPVVRPVTTQELNSLADDLGLRCTHEELEGFKGTYNMSHRIKTDTYRLNNKGTDQLCSNCSTYGFD